MARYTCGFGLDGLSTTNFQSFRSSVGIECHILCLERCGLIAVLLEDAAEGGSNDALSHITARPGKHNRMKFLHKFHFSECKDSANPNISPIHKPYLRKLFLYL